MIDSTLCLNSSVIPFGRHPDTLRATPSFLRRSRNPSLGEVRIPRAAAGHILLRVPRLMARPVHPRPASSRGLLDRTLVRSESQANAQSSRLQRDGPRAGEPYSPVLNVSACNPEFDRAEIEPWPTELFASCSASQVIANLLPRSLYPEPARRDSRLTPLCPHALVGRAHATF